MQNTISENETLSSSSTVPITDESISMKPKKGLSKTVSAIQNVSDTTIKRPYGSMPNLTAAAITIGYLVIRQDCDPAGTDCCYGTAGFHWTDYILSDADWIGKLRRTTNPRTSVRGSRDPISARLVWSAGFCRRTKPWWLKRIEREEPRFDWSFERLWCSMPYIALHYTDNVFYDTEI